MKQINYNGKYIFRVRTWESSKGLVKGFKGWDLCVYVPTMESWYRLEGSLRDYPLHPMNADKAAQQAMNDALSGVHDECVRCDVRLKPYKVDDFKPIVEK